MSNLDLFLTLLGTTDVRKKISIGDDIISFLSAPESTLKCEDIGMFIDGLVPWVNNSNFKVTCIEYFKTISLRLCISIYYFRSAKMDWIF